MPIGLVGALSLGASVVGSAMQAGAASDAAAAQSAAADKQLALQKQIYEETSANYKPWLEGGGLANEAYLYELGLGPKPTYGGAPAQIEEYTSGGGGQPQQQQPGAGLEGFLNLLSHRQPSGPLTITGRRGNGGDEWSDGDQLRSEFNAAFARQNQGTTRFRVNGQDFATREEAQAYANANPTGGTEYQGYQKTPGYDFQLAQGMDSIQSTAAARGNLLSGSTIKSAQTYGQGLANQDYGNYLNRLSGVSAQGQAAAGNQAAAGANYGANAGNALAGAGNAQAAGAIGSANAWSNGINNVLGSVGYMSGAGSTGPNSPASMGAWKFGAI